MRGEYHEAEEARSDNPREAFLGLGANLGDRAGTLAAALQMIADIEGVGVLEQSSVYETEPVGVTDQPPFLNMVARVRLQLAPEELLDALQEIERALGRTPTVRHGPRAIDLDVLLIDDLQISTSRLTIPHPELHRRQFVVVPLAEIAPELALPGGATTGDLSAGESSAVRRLGPIDAVVASTAGGDD